MREAARFFLSMLRLELADLHRDIEVLIKTLKKERDEGKITNYVCWENTAVLKNELISLDGFRKVLGQMMTRACGSLPEVINKVRITFRKYLKEYCLYEAVLPYVDRKITKVVGYVDH